MSLLFWAIANGRIPKVTLLVICVRCGILAVINLKHSSVVWDFHLLILTSSYKAVLDMLKNQQRLLFWKTFNTKFTTKMSVQVLRYWPLEAGFQETLLSHQVSLGLWNNLLWIEYSRRDQTHANQFGEKEGDDQHQEQIEDENRLRPGFKH